MIVTFSDEDIFYAQLKLEKMLDSTNPDLKRKEAGARIVLLSLMKHHLEERKAIIKRETVSALFKPFSPGLWYASKTCHMEAVWPNRWHRAVFEKGDPIVILRCAGWNSTIGSWWWIVDKDGTKIKVLWRYESRPFEWEMECPLPSSE